MFKNDFCHTQDYCNPFQKKKQGKISDAKVQTTTP